MSGCEKTKENEPYNLNNSELFSTGQVITLLNENGASLTKAADFPIDLALCKVSGKMPQPYISGDTGIYYMFYIFDGYSETGKLAATARFYEYTDSDRSYSDYIIPGGIAGKNLYICQWSPELGSWAGVKNEIDREALDIALKERTSLSDILYKKAFDQKKVTLTGRGEFWEVRIPVEYIYNLRESEDGIPEQLFVSSNKTFVKYLGPESNVPVVYSMGWSHGSNESTLTYEKSEGSILDKEATDGFHKASSGNIADFNPETEESLIVTITWGSGETEEITCSLPETKE
jgi:hypothetical protein